MTSLESIHLVHLVLTSACNLRCAYCYQHRRASRTMSWQTLRAAIDLALRHGRPRVELVFSGGEPLLAYPLIERAVEYTTSRCPPQKSITYTLLTNGTLLSDDIGSFLQARNFELQLSFDGIPAMQKLRSAASFTHLDGLLKRMQQRQSSLFHNNLIVNVTLVPETIPHLADSMAYLLNRGVRRVAIAAAAIAEQKWSAAATEELHAQFGRIRQLCDASRRRTGEMPLLLLRGSARPMTRISSERSMCGVTRVATPAVDMDGQVYGCAGLVGSLLEANGKFLRSRLEELSLGHITDPELPGRFAAFPQAARRTEIFHRKREKYSYAHRCGECEYLAQCYVCPVTIGLLRGNEDPRRIPDFQCAFNRVVLRHRRESQATGQ